jgi:6-phosphogluconolactonase
VGFSRERCFSVIVTVTRLLWCSLVNNKIQVKMAPQAEVGMFAKRLGIAAGSLLALMVSGCGAGNSNRMPTPPANTCTPATKPAFAYVLDAVNADSVSMFTIDSCTGALMPTNPANIATGFLAENMVVDPSGKFVYVANLVSNASDEATISMYTIDSSTGVLTPTTPATVATGYYPQGIGVDPFSRFVYTANSDSNTVSMFTINPATGVLTATTPASVATGWSPLSVTVHPSGKFAYVANQDDGTISMYTINPNTGVLAPTTPATVPTGSSPFGVTVDPTGKFAYVPNTYANNTVSQYTIDPVTGVLSPSTLSEAATGNQPTEVMLDPSGKFAYVINRQDNTISMYTLDANTGDLTPNFPPTISTGMQPFRGVFDPSGKFAYVVNENDGSVSVYTLNPNGTLTSAGASETGIGPVAVAATAGAK